MNKRSFDANAPPPVAAGAAGGIARGACRLLGDMGYAAVLEFKLRSRRRVDVIGLDRAGSFIIVEVKSSAADFRSDAKWPEYLEHCDEFFFAVAEDFPHDILPAEHGLIIADRWGGEILRPSPETKINAARRKALTLKFARNAAARLRDLTDPNDQRYRSSSSRKSRTYVVTPSSSEVKARS